MTTRPASIRRRMVVATLTSMLLIFAGIGLAAHRLARHESEELFSARLATSARVLEALLAHPLEKATISRPLVIALPRELETLTADGPESYGHPYETKIAFQVWDRAGRQLARSASAPAGALAPLLAGFSRNRIGGQDWQVFALRTGEVWVLTAEKDEVREEMANGIGMSILLPLAIGGVLMVGAVNLILVLNLRPLRELATRIARRDPDSLAPIELSSSTLELAPIVTELNQLLDRIKAAFEREQRFISAAAHEIRTPIAAVQLHVENALRADSEAARLHSLHGALSGVRRTGKLAEQLLALSRLTARVDAAQARPVPLRALCCEVIGETEALLEQRGQSIGLEAQDECLVWGEPHQLKRLLQNLIDNASLYGAPAGDIEVGLARHGERTLLSVANDGAPIPQDQVEKIFMPYYRILGPDTPGSGLGLAIVKEIADQHGARIHLGSKADGQGVVVQVSLAVHAPPARHAP